MEFEITLIRFLMTPLDHKVSIIVQYLLHKSRFVNLFFFVYRWSHHGSSCHLTDLNVWWMSNALAGFRKMSYPSCRRSYTSFWCHMSRTCRYTHTLICSILFSLRTHWNNRKWDCCLSPACHDRKYSISLQSNMRSASYQRIAAIVWRSFFSCWNRCWWYL